MNALLARWRGPHGAMPTLPRVTLAIAVSQRESERWVAAAQIAVIGAAALAYTFTPRGFSPDAPIAALPLGIFAMVLLIALRAWFAYSRQLTDPVLAASVVAEMVVMLGMLWGFAPQYETTLSVALKNALFVAIFVLIALRALRFEPVWVWLSGLTAAIGWSLLAFFAWREAGPSGQTMDFVVAATTGRIDIHDEIIRVAAILIVTAVLAVALARARLTLARAVASGQSADALSRFFDSEVADQITTTDLAPMAGQSVMREAAIMFTDLRGFTKAVGVALTRRPHCTDRRLPERRAASRARARRQHRQVHGRRHSRELRRGARVVDLRRRRLALHRCPARRVAAMARDRETRGRNALAIGIGVAHGPVTFGIIGVERRLEYTVIGETVNLAAKLEKTQQDRMRERLCTGVADRARHRAGSCSARRRIRDAQRLRRRGSRRGDGTRGLACTLRRPWAPEPAQRTIRYHCARSCRIDA